MSYRFIYDEKGVYGNVVGLVLEHAAGRGLHLDLGCGWGAIAEPLSEAGLTYVGFDIDATSVADLQKRGFEAHRLDLSDPVAVKQVLTEVIAERPVSSITMMDILEHITTDAEILCVLRELVVTGEPAPLIVSVPNVGHLDIAAKLMAGRWDYTETGLLDYTHIRFFTDSGLTQAMDHSGWAQVGADDFRLPVSDQHFPETSIVLSRKSALGGLLQQVRESAGYGAAVNQFVRAYLPGTPRPSSLHHDRSSDDAWPLTVLVRTQGLRPHTLRDTLLCLLAQTVQDFEVIVLAHDVTVTQQIEVEQAVVELPASLRERTRVLAVDGGGRARPLNRGVEAARGAYIAVLDDDDTVFAHWVETFMSLARKSPGRLCRTVAVSQRIGSTDWSDGRPGFHTEGPIEQEFPSEFDLFAHLALNRTPFMCWAIPRALFSELGLRFDDTLSVCEDWDIVMRGSFICGVASSEETVANYRRWQDGVASHLAHDRADWESDAERIVGRLNQQPTVLAPGAARRLRALISAEELAAALLKQREELWAERAELETERLELQSAWEQERAQMVQDYVDRGGLLSASWQQAEALSHQLSQVSDILNDVTASASWRLTAPLRKAFDTARAQLSR